jgi:hypothetical protein
VAAVQGAPMFGAEGGVVSAPLSLEASEPASVSVEPPVEGLQTPMLLQV